MRISDWSSDVCSSDLRHIEVFTMRGLLTVLWHGDPDSEAAVVLGGGAMGGLLGPGDALYHWLGDELAAPGTGISVLRVGWRRPNDLRSEEHTSELQSLMRISYAVFCLKKKTIIFTQRAHALTTY